MYSPLTSLPNGWTFGSKSLGALSAATMSGNKPQRLCLLYFSLSYSDIFSLCETRSSGNAQHLDLISYLENLIESAFPITNSAIGVDPEKRRLTVPFQAR